VGVIGSRSVIGLLQCCSGTHIVFPCRAVGREQQAACRNRARACLASRATSTTAGAATPGLSAPAALEGTVGETMRGRRTGLGSALGRAHGHGPSQRHAVAPRGMHRVPSHAPVRPAHERATGRGQHRPAQSPAAKPAPQATHVGAEGEATARSGVRVQPSTSPAS
jgi:hypothetical protein